MGCLGGNDLNCISGDTLFPHKSGAISSLSSAGAIPHLCSVDQMPLPPNPIVRHQLNPLTNSSYTRGAADNFSSGNQLELLNRDQQM